MNHLRITENKTKGTLELIHTDLIGPHNKTGHGGEKYFSTFVDDYSKCASTYCIKNKSEIANYLIEYINCVENPFGKILRQIQCDTERVYE